MGCACCPRLFCVQCWIFLTCRRQTKVRPLIKSPQWQLACRLVRLVALARRQPPPDWTRTRTWSSRGVAKHWPMLPGLTGGAVVYHQPAHLYDRRDLPHDPALAVHSGASASGNKRVDKKATQAAEGSRQDLPSERLTYVMSPTTFTVTGRGPAEVGEFHRTASLSSALASAITQDARKEAVRHLAGSEACPATQFSGVRVVQGLVSRLAEKKLIVVKLLDGSVFHPLKLRPEQAAWLRDDGEGRPSPAADKLFQQHALQQGGGLVEFLRVQGVDEEAIRAAFGSSLVFETCPLCTDYESLRDAPRCNLRHVMNVCKQEPSSVIYQARMACYSRAEALMADSDIEWPILEKAIVEQGVGPRDSDLAVLFPFLGRACFLLPEQNEQEFCDSTSDPAVRVPTAFDLGFRCVFPAALDEALGEKSTAILTEIGKEVLLFGFVVRRRMRIALKGWWRDMIRLHAIFRPTAAGTDAEDSLVGAPGGVWFPCPGIPCARRHFPRKARTRGDGSHYQCQKCADAERIETVIRSVWSWDPGTAPELWNRLLHRADAQARLARDPAPAFGIGAGGAGLTIPNSQLDRAAAACGLWLAERSTPPQPAIVKTAQTSLLNFINVQSASSDDPAVKRPSKRKLEIAPPFQKIIHKRRKKPKGPEPGQLFLSLSSTPAHSTPSAPMASAVPEKVPKMEDYDQPMEDYDQPASGSGAPPVSSPGVPAQEWTLSICNASTPGISQATPRLQPSSQNSAAARTGSFQSGSRTTGKSSKAKRKSKPMAQARIPVFTPGQSRAQSRTLDEALDSEVTITAPITEVQFFAPCICSGRTESRTIIALPAIPSNCEIGRSGCTTESQASGLPDLFKEIEELAGGVCPCGYCLGKPSHLFSEDQVFTACIKCGHAKSRFICPGCSKSACLRCHFHPRYIAMFESDHSRMCATCIIKFIRAFHFLNGIFGGFRWGWRAVLEEEVSFGAAPRLMKTGADAQQEKKITNKALPRATRPQFTSMGAAEGGRKIQLWDTLRALDVFQAAEALRRVAVSARVLSSEDGVARLVPASMPWGSLVEAMVCAESEQVVPAASAGRLMLVAFGIFHGRPWEELLAAFPSGVLPHPPGFRLQSGAQCGRHCARNILWRVRDPTAEAVVLQDNCFQDELAAVLQRRGLYLSAVRSPDFDLTAGAMFVVNPGGHWLSVWSQGSRSGLRDWVRVDSAWGVMRFGNPPDFLDGMQSCRAFLSDCLPSDEAPMRGVWQVLAGDTRTRLREESGWEHDLKTVSTINIDAIPAGQASGPQASTAGQASDPQADGDGRRDDQDWNNMTRRQRERFRRKQAQRRRQS